MTRALVLVALLVSPSGALSAAPNCPANTTDVKSGRVEPGGDPVTFAIDLKPCQTLSITVESSTPTPLDRPPETARTLIYALPFQVMLITGSPLAL